jgi:4-azaleucine resistance transporter AzlC
MASSIPEQPISPLRELCQGSRDIFPLVVGAIPFGVIFGTLSESSGLSFWGALAMSAFVFAGSAQFIALGLLATGANVGVLWLTTLVVNLRHLLYSVSLIPHVKGLSRPWKVLIGFGLTDEGFVATIRRFEKPGTPVWYYLGATGLMYSAWQLSTLLGLTAGQWIPDAQGWGLDFAMSVTFIGMVVPYLITRPMGAAVLVAGGLALLTYGWPHKLGLMVSVLVGVGAGYGMERKSTLDRGAEHLP